MGVPAMLVMNMTMIVTVVMIAVIVPVVVRHTRVSMRMVVMIVVMGHGARDNHCGVSPVRLKRLCARGKSNTITAVPQMAADNGVNPR